MRVKVCDRAIIFLCRTTPLAASLRAPSLGTSKALEIINASVPLAPAGRGARGAGVTHAFAFGCHRPEWAARRAGAGREPHRGNSPHAQPLSRDGERGADVSGFCQGNGAKRLRKSLLLARMQMAVLFFYFLCLLCGTCLASEPGMVFIPGGEFPRGRSYDWPDTRLAWYPNPLKDDTPVRRVYVNPFYMDEAEVTNERYAAFARATRRKVPYHWRRDGIPKGQEKHPVVNVSWDDAAAFCGWEQKRLPTEAEWERASRGLAEGRIYPWGDSNPTPQLAVYGSDTGAQAVCSKERNYFGLCDIIGNVWEWTTDWYDRNYYAVAPDRDPPGPAQGIYRVLRGGSWFDQPQPQLFLSCSYRSWARPAERSPTIGFRCVRAVTPRKADHRASLSH